MKVSDMTMEERISRATYRFFHLPNKVKNTKENLKIVFVHYKFNDDHIDTLHDEINRMAKLIG